jgi:hypothetical protein
MTVTKVQLCDVAKIVRSKNAGPFLITLDVIFKSVPDYINFKNNNYITHEKIQELYKIKKSELIEILFYDNAKALKVTIKRLYPSGSPGDTDIYGAQQHVPLLLMELTNWK